MEVKFPDIREDKPQPLDRDYRLSRKVLYNGTVHWQIEQYVCSQLTLKELFPGYPTDKMVHVNGKPVPRDWIPLREDFGTEEEAIEFLNNTLRAREVMEVTHYYLD